VAHPRASCYGQVQDTARQGEQHPIIGRGRLYADLADAAPAVAVVCRDADPSGHPALAAQAVAGLFNQRVDDSRHRVRRVGVGAEGVIQNHAGRLLADRAHGCVVLAAQDLLDESRAVVENYRQVGRVERCHLVDPVQV